MKIRVTMDLDIPDSFFETGKYENASIQQNVWEMTLQKLQTDNLIKKLDAMALKDEAKIKYYDILYNIFLRCNHKIEKILDSEKLV